MSKFATATQAQDAFYRAFSECSIESMSAIWSGDEDAVCVHPGSDVLHGKSAIIQSWSRILAPGMSATIEIEPISVFEGHEVAVHVVYEYLHTGPVGQMATVIATNVFRLGESGWQIVEHHGTQPLMRDNSSDFVAPSDRVLQ